MPIEKINFSYPKGSLQSVYDTEELTALELASKTSKKVDECIEMVNGVEQSAIQATAIVDNMQASQNQFLLDMGSTLDNTKNSMDLALSTFETSLDSTKVQVTADATAVISNAGQQITDNVNTKLGVMANDGTLAAIINQDLLTGIEGNIAANEVVVAQAQPNTANLWCEVITETEININSQTLILEQI